MQTQLKLDLATAKQIAAAAEMEAERNQWQVVIAIVDDGGHLLYLQRDQAQLGSIEVAIQKAKSALAFRRPTLFWQNLIDQGQSSYLDLPGVVPIEGGLTLLYAEQIVGAIGISGVTSVQDGQIAAAGALYLSELHSATSTP